MLDLKPGDTVYLVPKTYKGSRLVDDILRARATQVTKVGRKYFSVFGSDETFARINGCAVIKSNGSESLATVFRSREEYEQVRGKEIAWELLQNYFRARPRPPEYMTLDTLRAIVKVLQADDLANEA